MDSEKIVRTQIPLMSGKQVTTLLIFFYTNALRKSNKSTTYACNFVEHPYVRVSMGNVYFWLNGYF